MFIICSFYLLDLAAEKIFEKASSYYYFLPVCLNLGKSSKGFSSAYDFEFFSYLFLDMFYLDQNFTPRQKTFHAFRCKL